jgi:hypothetical protein
MSSLYFICLNFIAEKEDFQLFFKKYISNYENDFLDKIYSKYIFQTNIIDIKFKYIPKELLNYGLNEVILSDLFSLMYVKTQLGICMYYNCIIITNMDRFIDIFHGSIYLMHNYYLFHYDSIYIKILLLNKYNIVISEPFSVKSTLMDYNIQKYNSKYIIKHYNLQNCNEYYVLHLFNKK